MLRLTIPETEYYNEAENRFVTAPAKELQLEHSLVSISKWESRWKKPFLEKTTRSLEETTDYIRCMTITQNVDDSVYSRLTMANVKQVEAYIDDSMTATTFKKKNTSGHGIVTSEIIYYWMIELGIPMECQKWHLNRLLTLIRVCDEKSQPKKKMSRHDAARQYRDLNAARRRRLGTRG